MAAKDIANPIDVNRQGLIGKDIDRVDGPLKVAGKATYSYEYNLTEGKAAYGYIVNSGIAKGKIASIDIAGAKAMPGVLAVMTHENAPKQKGKNPTAEKKFTDPKPYLKDANIRYFGEPVAFVVAETFETARAAAALVHVTYDQAHDTIFYVGPNKDKGVKPSGANQPPDSAVGDFEAAYKAAPVKIDSTYTTPYQNHNAMELHATLAVWHGDKLVVYSANQLPVEAQTAIAKTFNMSKDDVQVICRYIGGGFGGKLPVQCDAILAAQAAKELGRPVKVAMTRQQVFFNATHRTESLQHIRLGAEKDGRLTAIAHECWTQTSTFDEYAELAASCTRSLYAAPDRLTSHRIVACDLPPSGSMRAPGEAIGMLTLEQAMDEMAHQLSIDPIELRIRNEPTEDPEKKIPFSTRALIPCMREGATRFGWDKRNPKPGQTRDGNWLVGIGMAAAIRPNFLQKSAAKVQLDKSGHVTAKLAMTDPGTGTYTVLTQIAAETMGVPMKAVTVEMGDTSFPPTPGSGGSWGANSAGSGLYNACMALREQLAKFAVGDKGSPLYKEDKKAAEFEDGKIVIGGKSEYIRDLAARMKPEDLEADGKIAQQPGYKTHSQHSFGAFFAEVGVDRDTAEIRLRRMLGVFAAGRILNAKTARSQAIGGMIWGLGSALHEESVVDKRWGQFVNHDLGEYHVPVHADAANVDAYFLPEVDDKTGPLKIKGVGELGICGAGASVANAVFNACGVRVREYPLTLDKLLAKMPKAA